MWLCTLREAREMLCSTTTIAWMLYSFFSTTLLLLVFLYISFRVLLKFIKLIGSIPFIFRAKTEICEEGDEEGSDDDFTEATTPSGNESWAFWSREDDDDHVNELPQSSDDFTADSNHVSDVGDDEDSESGAQFYDLMSTDSECSESEFSKELEAETKSKPMHPDYHIFANKDEMFFDYVPNQKEEELVEMKKENDETCTIGSTSKSSLEWRSSIKDSGTEDPFSSSSRRSCQKWETYAVFQTYDEEMKFLDTISAQKLNETESLRSIRACPRSISDRIVYKFNSISKNPEYIRRNPYNELESTYVAQICLTWEALNWSYVRFKRKRESDHGCPAHVAQQFQQFQVLLQRYVENEPYEQGRRPEVYARMRLLAPKLLLVPEYRDDDDDIEDGFNSRISSSAFQIILEDGVRTFYNFLKADKEKSCEIFSAIFRRGGRVSVDPALLQLMKKVNHKKQAKLKEMRKAGKCLVRKRLNLEEEMEIQMGLIDLDVVSKVLRTVDIREPQLHWCEKKMSKLRVQNGKLERDSSPLFFPAH